MIGAWGADDAHEGRKESCAEFGNEFFLCVTFIASCHAAKSRFKRFSCLVQCVNSWARVP